MIPKWPWRPKGDQGGRPSFEKAPAVGDLLILSSWRRGPSGPGCCWGPGKTCRSRANGAKRNSHKPLGLGQHGGERMLQLQRNIQLPRELLPSSASARRNGSGLKAWSSERSEAPSEGEPEGLPPCRAGAEGRQPEGAGQTTSANQKLLRSIPRAQQADHGTQFTRVCMHTHTHTLTDTQRLEERIWLLFQNGIANCQSSLKKELTQANRKRVGGSPAGQVRELGALLTPALCRWLARVRHREGEGRRLVGRGRAGAGRHPLCPIPRAEGHPPSQEGSRLTVTGCCVF